VAVVLLRNEYVTRGFPNAPDHVLVEIVDEVYLPLVRGRSVASRSGTGVPLSALILHAARGARQPQVAVGIIMPPADGDVPATSTPGRPIRSRRARPRQSAARRQRPASLSSRQRDLPAEPFETARTPTAMGREP